MFKRAKRKGRLPERVRRADKNSEITLGAKAKR